MVLRIPRVKNYTNTFKVRYISDTKQVLANDLPRFQNALELLGKESLARDQYVSVFFQDSLKRIHLFLGENNLHLGKKFYNKLEALPVDECKRILSKMIINAVKRRHLV